MSVLSQVTAGIDCADIGPMMLKFTPKSKNTNDDYYEPWGVAADPDGLFVVSDHHNHRLQVGLPMLYCDGNSKGFDGPIVRLKTTVVISITSLAIVQSDEVSSLL